MEDYRVYKVTMGNRIMLKAEKMDGSTTLFSNSIKKLTELIENEKFNRRSKKNSV